MISALQRPVCGEYVLSAVGQVEGLLKTALQRPVCGELAAFVAGEVQILSEKKL